MILLLTMHDGTERGYDVPEGTMLLSALREGYWFFQTVSGGQVSLSAEIVAEASLGNVQLVAKD